MTSHVCQARTSKLQPRLFQQLTAPASMLHSARLRRNPTPHPVLLMATAAPPTGRDEGGLSGGGGGGGVVVKTCLQTIRFQCWHTTVRHDHRANCDLPVSLVKPAKKSKQAIGLALDTEPYVKTFLGALTSLLRVSGKHQEVQFGPRREVRRGLLQLLASEWPFPLV